MWWTECSLAHATATGSHFQYVQFNCSDCTPRNTFSVHCLRLISIWATLTDVLHLTAAHMNNSCLRQKPMITSSQHYRRYLFDGLLRRPSPTPFRKLRAQTPSQNLHCKLRPNGARYNGAWFNSIDMQRTGTYHLLIQQCRRRPPRGIPSSKRAV